MASQMAALHPRHIQDFANAASLRKHWGYADQVWPCTSDKGSCEYLDVVYGSHDRSMIYTAVLWALLFAIFATWAIVRRATRPAKDGHHAVGTVGGLSKVGSTLAATSRRYLLAEPGHRLRSIFGRTTKLQITILAILSAYLIVFSFVGMKFAHWRTPIKAHPGLYQTRSTLGPFSDRVGILAYALTPFSIFLASRESVLSLATGLPYQSFNFLHRWLGYIILVQAFAHTMGWTLVEAVFYGPQPMTARMFFGELYIVWGFVAIFFLFAIFVLSLPSIIRRTGYEFFRKAHYVLAMLYIGACWGHWAKLYVFLLAALILWGIDRGLRLLRTAYLQFRPTAASPLFRSAEATVTTFPDPTDGDIVRLDFNHPRAKWTLGQHFFLTFPTITLWQSHPFTPACLPTLTADGYQHSYIFRARAGETRRVAIAARAASASASPSIPVTLTGPYGTATTSRLGADVNLLCVAGGTGITFVLPAVIEALAKKQRSDTTTTTTTTTTHQHHRKITLVWAMRRRADAGWVEAELRKVRELAAERGGDDVDVEVRLFVTREEGKGKGAAGVEVKEKEIQDVVAAAAVGSGGESSSDEGEDVRKQEDDDGSEKVGSATMTTTTTSWSVRTGRPELKAVLDGFVADTVAGRTAVLASGPGEMISDLRGLVAGLNDGGKVWRGNLKGDVELTCDDRLEW